MGGQITVGENARIIGDCYADSIIIHGRVEGNIFARSYCGLMPSAKVNGEIDTKAFELKEGAVYGQCKVNRGHDHFHEATAAFDSEFAKKDEATS